MTELLSIRLLQCTAPSTMGTERARIQGARCIDQAVGFHKGKPLCYPHLCRAGGQLVQEEPPAFAERWRRIEREGAVVR